MERLKENFKKSENETINQMVMFYCLVLLALGLPSSRFLVSVVQIVLVINWLVEGGLKNKLKLFFSNKPVFWFCSIFVIFVVGLLWTGDLARGFDFDLKNKLPLFTFPLVLATSKPLSRARILALPLVFSFAVLVVSIIGAFIFFSSPYVDTQLLSPFTVHIHYGQMVLFTIFLLPWVVRRVTHHRSWFYFSLVVSFWLLVFLFLLSSLIVFASLAVVLIFIFVKVLFSRKEKFSRIFAATGFLTIIVASVLLLHTIVSPLAAKIDNIPNNLTETTSAGNPYTHDLDSHQRENGYLLGTYIAEDELRSAWNQRSFIDFDSLDLNGNHIKYTVYRFLASKGLRKDREGLSRIADTEVEAIENGVANHLYLKWPRFFGRIHQSFWEIQQYQLTGNPNGHSLSQRFELWRASVVAIKKYPLFGWGTGGVLKGLEYGLDSMDSMLENRKMGPHNQFLVFLVMVGIIGTVSIFVFLVYFLIKTKALVFFPAKILVLLIFVAMLGDVPFDYQMGINFSLFYLIYFGVLFPPISNRLKKS